MSALVEVRREYLLAVCEALQQYIRTGGEITLATERLDGATPSDTVSFTVSQADKFQELVAELTAKLVEMETPPSDGSRVGST